MPVSVSPVSQMFFFVPEFLYIFCQDISTLTVVMPDDECSRDARPAKCSQDCQSKHRVRVIQKHGARNDRNPRDPAGSSFF